MHNGCLGSFALLRRRLLAQLNGPAFDFAVTNGSSDTALCFAIFLDHLEDHLTPCTAETLRATLDATIAVIERAVHAEDDHETSLLNFVVSDGHSLVATRYVINRTNPNAKPASLYYASGNSYQPDGSVPGNYAMRHTDRRPTLAIISSEPLTEHRADWVSVPRNFSVVITNSLHILLFPIRAAPHEQPDATIPRVLVNLAAAGMSDRTTAIATSPTPTTNITNTTSHGSTILTPSSRNTLLRSKSIQQGSALDLLTKQNSQNSTLASTSTVRAVITVPDRVLLCCTMVHSLLCTGAADGTVHVWDVDDNRHHTTLRSGTHAVLAMLGDDDLEVLIVATSGSVILIYSLSERQEFEQKVVVFCEGMGDVMSLAIVNGSLFAGFSDTGVRCIVKDIEAEVEQTVSSDIVPSVPCNGFADAVGRVVKISDVECRFPSSSQRPSHNGSVFALVSCLQASLLCSGSGDGILRVWDLRSEQCVQERFDHAGAILALVAYEVPQGTLLFSGSRDRSVKVWVWDGESGFVCKRTLRKHKDEVIFLSIAGNKLISGSADGVVCVWCALTLRLLRQYRDGCLKAGAVSVFHDSLFTASDGSIQVRDIVSKEKGMKGKHNANVSTNSLSEAGGSFADIEPNGDMKFNVAQEGPQNDKPSANNEDLGKNTAIVSGDESTGISDGPMVSEVDDEDSDDAELVPGVTNEVVLAPPMARSMEILGDFAGEHANNSTEPGSSSSLLPDATENDSCSSWQGLTSSANAQTFERRLMQDVLHRFISFPTVSNSEEHRENCWRGARYIARFLEGMGARVKYFNTSVRNKHGEKDEIPSHFSSKDVKALATASATNPIVLARFASSNPNAQTITLYGHYDVMPAVDLRQWDSNPWALTDVNGYFYGRGSTDNKGPIVAMVFAIKKLLEESKDGLGINIVLILQGEGEAANAGFKECVKSNIHWFDRTSLILTSNSYWLGEDKPCITYGFRGIIELLVSVTGGAKNLHSGVDGGALLEPMNDLITILGTMVDASGVVCIPGFYDDVNDLTEEDKDMLRSVDFNVNEYRKRTGVELFTQTDATELLASRWRRPSVSITAIETSNVSGFFSVVPRKAEAKISIRFVPDQDPSKLEKAIRAHLQFELRKRRSPNELHVTCVNRGDWWLGNPSGKEFQIAARAVRAVWGVEPEYVCEGGSMPLFSFLAKALEAPLVQVPLGQSSDGAHLPNERIRSINLFRGKEVLQRIIKQFAETRGLTKECDANT